MKLILLYTFTFFLISFSFCQSSMLIGSATANEYAYGICSDDVGNIYFGATSDNQSWVFKRNANNQLIWSKKLTMHPTYGSDISFIDVIGDTIFGCGWVKNGSTIVGGTIFKINAVTGVPYWIKSEATSKTYFSSIKYANGKFYLTGSQVNNSSGYNGKVVAVSSADGSIIWQTQAFGVSFPGFGVDYIDDFTASTEMVNGKMFITGRSYVDGASNLNMRSMLIGIDETGNIFLNKYLQFNTSSASASRFYGLNIQYDGADSLVIVQYGDDNCTNCTNNIAGLIKTDLSGNVSWCKEYNLGGITLEVARGLNITSDSYVFYGYANLNQNNSKMFAIKTNKFGEFQFAKLISLGSGNLGHISGPVNCGGSSDYKNNKHYIPGAYFTTNTNSRDIAQIVLDDDLNDPNGCLSITPTTVITNVYTPFSGQVNLNSYPNALSFDLANNSTELSFVEPCTQPISFTQSSYCSQVTITALIPNISNPIFNWSNGENTQTISVSQGDTLYLTIMNPLNCCSLTDTVIPNFFSSDLSVSLPSDTVICASEGNNLELIADILGGNGLANIIWNTGENNDTISITNSGTYWVTASDNCTSISDSINVVFNSIIIPTADSTVILCDGQFPFLLNANLENANQYLWNTGENLDSIIVSDFGEYYLIGSNMCGSDTLFYQVSPYQPFNYVLFSDIDTCLYSNDELFIFPSISNATSTLSFLWNELDTNNVFVIDSSMIVTVKIEDQCQTIFDTVSVTINNFSNISNDTLLSVCANNFPVLVSPIIDNFNSVVWNDGTSGISNNISSPGQYVIYSTNYCGTDSLIIQIESISAPTYTPFLDVDTCAQNNYTISPTINNTSNSVNYIWNTGSTNPTVTVNATGTYWVQINDQCLSVIDTLNLNFISLPNIIIDSVFNLCAIEFPFLLNPQIQNANYVNWGSGINTNDFLANQEGVYSVVAQNVCGTDSLSIEINIIPEPFVDLMSEIDTCVSDNQSVSVNPLFSNVDTFSWSSGQTSSIASFQTSGEYILFGSNSCGSVSDTIQITIHHNPIAYFSNIQGCVGSDILFIDSSSTTESTINQWSWDFGDGIVSTVQNSTHVFSIADTFFVELIITTEYGCSDTITQEVSISQNVNKPLVINDSPKECPGDQVHLQIINPLNIVYNWSGPNGFASIGNEIVLNSYLINEGLYSVYSVQNGCKSEITFTTLTVNDLTELSSIVPNVITPNGDFTNEQLVLNPLFSNCYEYELFLLNRWGNIIYKQSNDSEPFKGVDLHGNEVSDGVYFYKLFYGDIEKNGIITILR